MSDNLGDNESDTPKNESSSSGCSSIFIMDQSDTRSDELELNELDELDGGYPPPTVVNIPQQEDSIPVGSLMEESFHHSFHQQQERNDEDLEANASTIHVDSDAGQMTPSDGRNINDDVASAATLKLSLKELLSKNIAKQILDSTDEFNKMLKDTVEKKLMLFKNEERVEKFNFRKIDFSLPESYSTKLKSDKGLMETILKLICNEIVENINKLILPELDIESLQHLICVSQVLDGVNRCSSIEIPFTAQTADEILKVLPNVICTLNRSLKPMLISCKPDSNALPLIAKPFTQLKKSLKQESGAASVDCCFESLRVTYNDTGIFGKAAGTKRKTTEFDDGTPSTKKKKKKDVMSAFPSKMKLCTISTNKENITFTFDSFQPQQNFGGSLFTAYDYWQLETVHKLGAMGEGTTIAIVDSGIDSSHPAFSSGQIIDFINFFQTDFNPSANDHGTMCAGIAAGNRFKCFMNPQDGTPPCITCPPGVAPKTKLVILKTLLHGETNTCYETVLHALQQILVLHTKKQMPINVVSMSLGSLQFVPEIAQAINELVSNNIIVVCAASNFGHKFSQPISFPARLGHVLCIGSHGPHGKPSVFSPVGQQIDFLAPGEDIAAPASSIYNHHYSVDSGTSFATPAVAGLICLILGYIKVHFPNDFHYFQNQWVMKEVLREISTSPGRHSDDQGFGALNPLPFFRQPTILNSVINNIFVGHDK